MTDEEYGPERITVNGNPPRRGESRSTFGSWILTCAVWACLCLLTPVLAAGASEPVSFQDRYQNLSSNGGSASPCSTSYTIRGREPAFGDSYPVFVFLMGTFESFPTPAAEAAMQEMARRGFVAATVDYPNGSFGGCSLLGRRSECVFDAGRSTSAVSSLCSRAAADCRKGVVVAGFSQGSILSILAHDYDTRITAVYGLGAGVEYSRFDLNACVADTGTRTLESTRLRAVNGENDGFLGPSPDGVRSQNEVLTGLPCGDTATQCFRSNGSGWSLVRGSQVADGMADHCYMGDEGCFSGELDPNWRNGSDSWALVPNLRWLLGRLEATLPDDRYEPNDSLGAAASVSDGRQDFLVALDDDYYGVPLEEGDTLDASIHFTHSDGNLELELSDPAGSLVETSNTSSDSETVGETDAVAGRYVIRVFGTAEDTNTYTLRVSSTNRSSDGSGNGSSGGGGGGGGGCLVQRMSVPKPVEDLLRALRDRLLDHGVGRAVTGMYYRL